MKLRFYGYSDDLVVVEGDISDEYGAYEGTSILLVAPDTTAFEFLAMYDGDWSFRVLHEPADGWSFEIDPEPAHEYSQALNVVAPEGTRVYAGLEFCEDCRRPVGDSDIGEKCHYALHDLYCWRWADAANCERGKARLAPAGQEASQ